MKYGWGFSSKFNSFVFESNSYISIKPSSNPTIIKYLSVPFKETGENVVAVMVLLKTFPKTTFFWFKQWIFILLSLAPVTTNFSSWEKLTL